MKKHLVAFLSLIGLTGIGLAGSATPVRAQVLKGADQAAKTAEVKTKQKTRKVYSKQKTAAATQAAKGNAEATGAANAAANTASKNTSKLKLQQEAVQKQNTANGQKNALTKAALTKAKGAEQR